MADLKKILGRLREENPTEDGFEQLSEVEASELEGGTGNSGCPVNKSCPIAHNQGCPP